MNVTDEDYIDIMDKIDKGFSDTQISRKLHLPVAWVREVRGDYEQYCETSKNLSQDDNVWPPEWPKYEELEDWEIVDNVYVIFILSILFGILVFCLWYLYF